MAQTDLATQLGVSPATASKIETGRQEVRFSQLWRLASVLDVSPPELVSSVNSAVELLRQNNVKVVVSQPASRPDGELTAVALGGLLEFLRAGRS